MDAVEDMDEFQVEDMDEFQFHCVMCTLQVCIYNK